ncbi:zinc finger MYM-type 1-like [Pelobates cultripes]|uniref:Zinc finger MYM-type 1-like n=1 Tax=Pelobates cultripes TaxID=61616 RepID=A0AAD1TJS3_PELCU|nr:zinc finger MYM-type 1-like [Pelobates cultripes]
MFGPHAQSTSDSIAGTSREAANTEQILEDECVEETAGLFTEEQGELGHPESPTEQVIADISECQTEVLDPSFNYFACPNRNELAVFLKYHPQHEIPDPVLKKSVKRKDGTIRKWLSYCKITKAMFCSVCLAFSKSHETNSFIEGMTDKHHVHQRIEEHEKSAMHNAEAFFLKSSSAGVDDLLLFKQMSVRREQVRNRLQVLHRVVDVVKVIGKQGLSYRGDKDEAAFNLEDITKDHGNFLELILLLSKYDICLKYHVNKCIEKSKILQLSRGKGRGSLVTLLSKTTVNKVLESIRLLIQETISNEVREAGMFSIQVDTTQDITSKDQCSIIVRYVKECIKEKLLAIVECEFSTGKNLFKLVMEVLKSYKLEITKCIGSSTDGAANMQGQYNGFSSWLSTESPEQVHIWCYAHILNLVLADTTKVVVASASLFSLLNDIAVFIRDSYQRTNTWEEVSQDPHHRRISVIGETRWWSKDAALRKVFGEFSNPDSALFLSLIYTLSKIEESV